MLALGSLLDYGGCRPLEAMGKSGRGYITFLDTARAEGERSTPWSPATGLNFKKDQTRKRKRKQRKTKKEEGEEERNLEVERDGEGEIKTSRGQKQKK